MVHRMTSKERIHQLAEEAAAGKKAKPKTEKKKKASSTIAKRYLAVWKVFNGSHKEVACFPYSEKSEAYAKAEYLTRERKNSHFVNETKVPME